jgi:hypothetical protein
MCSPAAAIADTPAGVSRASNPRRCEVVATYVPLTGRDDVLYEVTIDDTNAEQPPVTTKCRGPRLQVRSAFEQDTQCIVSRSSARERGRPDECIRPHAGPLADDRFGDWAVVTVEPRRLVAPLLRRTMSTDATFGRWKT